MGGGEIEKKVKKQNVSYSKSLLGSLLITIDHSFVEDDDDDVEGFST